MVLGEIGRFGNSPGQLLLPAELALRGYGRSGHGLQQALRGLAHQQRRHQVFEHRARPGSQPGRATHRQKRPAQRAPVALGHVALGNRQKAGQPRLGRQQVVVADVQRLVVNPQADVEQAALGVVQALEIHRLVQAGAAPGQAAQRCLRLPAIGAFLLVLLRQLVARLAYGQQQAGQISAVDGRHIGRQKDFQRARVVPVEQVAVVLGQLVDAVQ